MLKGECPSIYKKTYDFARKIINLATFDFEKLVLQGFLQLSKTLRDLSSSDHKVSGTIPVIRQKNIAIRELLFLKNPEIDGGWTQA